MLRYSLTIPYCSIMFQFANRPYQKDSTGKIFVINCLLTLSTLLRLLHDQRNAYQCKKNSLLLFNNSNNLLYISFFISLLNIKSEDIGR